MENIIFLYTLIVIFFALTINFIAKLFNIPISKNVLGCGIYGFSLKPGANLRVAMLKFKILGLYNIERGKDSCGISVSGDIHKGVNNLRLFSDFIEEKFLPRPKKENLVVIGHNRAATRGAHTEQNAHPFIIDNDLIGVHNGTIHNTFDLGKKYGILSSDYAVDSHFLYRLLYDKGFDILKEYHGAAALAFTYKKDPGVLYLYHGASKTYKNGQVTEERPLCYMETSEGVYFSSLASSLYAIRESDTDIVYDLDYNTVFKLKNGEFLDFTFKVDREEANIYSTNTGNFHSAHNRRSGGNNASITKNSTDQTGLGTIINPNNLLCASNSADVFNRKYTDITLQESLPDKICSLDKGTDLVFYYQNRFRSFNDFSYMHGPVYIHESGLIQKSSVEANLYYFWEGIFLKDREAYVTLSDLKANKASFLNALNGFNWAYEMSKYSRYPVTNLNHSGHIPDYYRNSYFFEHKRIINEFKFCTKFSNRTYFIKEAFLNKIESSDKDEKTTYTTVNLAYSEYNYISSGGKMIKGNNNTLPFKEESIPGGSAKFFQPGILETQNQKRNEGNTNDPKKDKSVDLESFDNGNSSEDKKITHNNGRVISISRNQIDDTPSGENFEECIEKEEDCKFFYEIKFKDFEEAMEVIGDVEDSALKEFYKIYIDDLLPVDKTSSLEDINYAINKSICSAINEGKTLIELIEEEEYKDLLIDIYDGKLESLSSDKEDEPVFESSDFAISNEVEEENNFIKEQINDQMSKHLNDIIDSAITLRNKADMLQMSNDEENEDTELSIVISRIYNCTDNLLSQVDEYASKKNLTEIVKRIDSFFKKTV